ncbi:MAG: M20/M25/M40 family metallo-hydrolase [Patescibacteria group bacterium]
MKSLKQQLLKTFLELIQINEVFPKEKEIVTYVESHMHEIDIPCEKDGFGNLICRLEGNGEPLFLNTHLDIPEPAPHIEYTIDGDILRSNGGSILGADPKSGLAVLLEVARLIRTHSYETRPVEFVFTLGEEAGLVGARNLDYAMVRSKMGLVIDEDGPAQNVVIRSPGTCELHVTVFGKTVHSRDWLEGVNAIAHISTIIASLQQGEIREGVTFNVGKLHGGTAVNSVAGSAYFEAEFRSFDMDLLHKTVANVVAQIHAYARLHKLDVKVTPDFQFASCSLDQTHSLFQRLERAYHNLGMKPNFYETYGGSDSNIFNANGITTAAIGSGYYLAHQYNEYINLQDMENLIHVLIGFLQE